MDPLQNPYGPGAGTPPPELAGRGELLRDAEVAIGRARAGRPHRGLIMVGLRGVGKTVLLNRIDDMARAHGFASAMVEATEDKALPALIVPQARRILYEFDRLGNVSAAVKRGLRVLTSFIGSVKVKLPGDVEFSLDFDPETGTADSGDLEADLADLLVALGEAAAARGKALVLLIDELQYLKEEEFSALIMGIHKTAQRTLPLVLIGAGLPQVVGLAGKARSYAERLFTFPQVGPLDPSDARRAIAEPARRERVRFADSALEEIVRVTAGYPYFIQEWSYQAWNLAERSPITRPVVEAATAVAIKRLDDGFFRVRFDRLTKAEQRYLRAMAELGHGPHRSGDIAEIYGQSVTSAAPIRGNLIAKGMIFSPAHGDTAFTVPLFDEYLRRVIPTVI
jgi:hypothetical protein